MQSLKEAIRHYLQFTGKVLGKVEELMGEAKLARGKEVNSLQVKNLESKLEEYAQALSALSQEENKKESVVDGALERAAKDLAQMKAKYASSCQELSYKLEVQAAICSELLRENECLKSENNNNKSLLMQTQAQLKNFLTSNVSRNTDSNHLERSSDINLVESRFETQQNEIDHLFLQNSQNNQTFHPTTNSSLQNQQQQHQRKRLQRDSNDNEDDSGSMAFSGQGGNQSDSPLTKVLFANESMLQNVGVQEAEQRLAAKVRELESLRQECRTRYVKKECLVQIINKLSETFSNLEFDASLLQQVLAKLGQENPDELELCYQVSQQIGLGMEIIKSKVEEGKEVNLGQGWQGEMELKSEVYQLKNRLLQSEQRRTEEVNQKNVKLAELEQIMCEEQRKRIESLDEKERVIESLEMQLESAREKCNVSQDRVSQQERQLQELKRLESQLHSFNQSTTGMPLSEIVLSLVQESERLSQTNRILEDSIVNLKEESYWTKTQLEEEWQAKVSGLDSKYQDALREQGDSYKKELKVREEQLKEEVSKVRAELIEKEREVEQLKTTMGEQIDQIQQNVDETVSHNQELKEKLETAEQELESKTVKEKQLLAKIIRLREQRSNLKSQQDALCQSLSEIFDYASQIEQQIVVRENQVSMKVAQSQEEMIMQAENHKHALKSVLKELTSKKCCADVGVQAESKSELELLMSEAISLSHPDKKEGWEVFGAKLDQIQQAVLAQNQYLQERAGKGEEGSQTPPKRGLENVGGEAEKGRGRQSLQNVVAFSTREKDFQKVHMQEVDGLLEQPTEEEELGKFWFEMYQRVKQELANERAHLKSMQKRDQEAEEGELMKEKIAELRQELAYLEKNNIELAQQLQESRQQHGLSQKHFEIKLLEEKQAIVSLVDQLKYQNRQLKGNYLSQVICKIEGHLGPEEGGLALAMEELLEMFKKLLKQLQMTQRELSKMQKEAVALPKQDKRLPFVEIDTSNSQQQQQPHYKNGGSSNRNSSHDCGQAPNLQIHCRPLDNNNNGQKAAEGGGLPPQTDRSRRHGSNKPTPQSCQNKSMWGPQGQHQSFQRGQEKNINLLDVSSSTQTTYENGKARPASTRERQDSADGMAYKIFQLVPGQRLTERQRLELYELRTAALREIEETEEKGKEADPYLKKYVKSIDDLLKKALQYQVVEGQRN